MRTEHYWWAKNKVKAPSAGQDLTIQLLSKQKQEPNSSEMTNITNIMSSLIENQLLNTLCNLHRLPIYPGHGPDAAQYEWVCLKVLQCELWPGGGAGWMLTGTGLTTGSTVVCRGWMMIVLACRGAGAWAKGTAVISGFGWMETFGPIWIGLLIGWACLAGVRVSRDGVKGVR